ncbi:bis(5'-nucleosyl)-tetraphosphatase (symmetrical) YqeK [Xylocopilactobacillus apis]|uniref:bis(5'-nucleosyl)-tetraphosphatase (symmetrical) n=1 Tax=Xylocopilactobacillus apis TaxID=2932183 RepID=A0AAU9CQL4_9LACO|nr:bis(5'-nucleosyl)-tetraphosphatase (symmetrical) YqeK [Xylocopilactobacillus apis]BDR56227.1 HD domain-containing protein [Xylocopilactobacillus apis]
MASDWFNYFKEIEKNKLSEHRYQHCISVSSTAESLAEKYGVDSKKAKLAGLLHDLYKQTDDQMFIDLIHSGHYDLSLLKYGNGVWHGFLGADLLKNEYHFYDEEILNSIRYHTISNPQMDNLAKVIFVADYIEPNRNFEEAALARMIAKEDLDAAVLFEIEKTVHYLMEKSSLIHPAMLLTYNTLYTNNLKYHELIEKAEENWK